MSGTAVAVVSTAGRRNAYDICLPLQGWSTIRYPLKNLSLLIKLENESLYGIFDSAVRCKSTFRSEPLWPIFDFGPPLPV